jgi:hypothetical protein
MPMANYHLPDDRTDEVGLLHVFLRLDNDVGKTREGHGHVCGEAVTAWKLCLVHANERSVFRGAFTENCVCSTVHVQG